MNTHPEQRRRAAQIVETVAGRLADLPEVVRIASAPHNVISTTEGIMPLWGALNLSDAYPGVALLFAELAAVDPAQRRPAHEYLSRGLAASPPPPPQQLFYGAGALAFAAQAAARGFGGYATLLAALDRSMAHGAAVQAAAALARVTAGEPIGHWTDYDLICGTGGVGCYLLARHGHTGDAMVTESLRSILTLFTTTALAADVPLRGTKVPAWWVHHDQLVYETDSGGHLDLGMAHGMSGPLALLALAWRAGVRVPGQDEAIARMAAVLDGLRREDVAGPYWPTALVLQDLGGETAMHRQRDVWCRGSAGLARALHLAGVALDDPGRQADAREALLAAIATARPERVNSMSLCHGWAGLLQITWRMAIDAGDPLLLDACDSLAGIVLGGFDDAAPFGFTYVHPRTQLEHERPGFLEGAAGIALALHSYAIGEPPATNWDAALLLN